MWYPVRPGRDLSTMIEVQLETKCCAGQINSSQDFSRRLSRQVERIFVPIQVEKVTIHESNHCSGWPSAPVNRRR